MSIENNGDLEYITVLEFSKALGIHEATAYKYIKRGFISKIKNIKGRMYIHKDEIEKTKEKANLNPVDDRSSYLTAFEVFEVLKKDGLCIRGTSWIHEKVSNGLIKRYMKFKNKLYIHKEEIKALKLYYFEHYNAHIPSQKIKDYYTINELSLELGIPNNQIYRYIYKNKISTFKLPHSKGNIFFLKSHLSLIKKKIGYIDKYNSKEFLSIQEIINQLAKHRINVTDSSIRHLIHTKRILNYVMHLNKYYCHKNELTQLLNYFTEKGYYAHIDTETQEQEKNKHLTNFLTVKQASEKLQAPPTWLRGLLKDYFPNSTKIPASGGYHWLVSKTDIEKFQKEYYYNHKTRRLHLIDHYDLDTLRSISGFTFDKLRLDIKKGLLTGAIQKNKRYFIPIQNANRYLESLQYVLDIVYDTHKALEDLLKHFNTHPPPSDLIKTSSIYKKWVEIKINSSNARPSSLRGYTLKFINLYDKILSYFHREIWTTSNAIIELFLSNKTLSNELKKIFVQFLSYCDNQNGINRAKKYLYHYAKKDDAYSEKNIYSFEVYHQYYTHVQNIEMHITNATTCRYYANMWAYTIILLTNNWRGTDIVHEFPSIELDSIRADKLSWFKTNKLTMEESQSIINQLYFKLRNAVANKVSVLYNFYVSPNLIESLAYSLVISELHKRNTQNYTALPENSLILGTFFFGKKIVSTRVSGMDQHLNFFNPSPQLKDFDCLTMNRSTMTYLFYSILEEDGEDADLALEITKNTRSHKNSDTTAIYIQAKNKDGSINRVSVNLLNRGMFGWLYNYILLRLKEDLQKGQTIEERTDTIKELRNSISPMELEKWAIFLQNIHTNKNRVIDEIKYLPMEELKTLAIKLFTNQMPSKEKTGQCLVYPNCKRKNLKTCYSCEYFIPEKMVLIEAISELKRLTNSLENTKYDAIRKRDSFFLLNIILLIDESLKAFGIDVVNSFLPLKEKTKILEKVKQRLLL
ncbi:DNA-binding protein [Bacillus mycoides]|uniref:helix-turn-helix domain-containing protein n=1 Tax=Bacillus TaxID=1386 RepID=UPI0009919045|nr:helix-turn-helix domain-containing protein [Bacillus mycoides]OOR00882.1 DNA-binding protein [Bacillus mycoides]HDR7588511.1 helix-turn-helix domain-containing protein [Bacillus mycoides]HDR7590628.1 helix-turn-helix domain-containing protein [Bacillus mycoides]